MWRDALCCDAWWASCADAACNSATHTATQQPASTRRQRQHHLAHIAAASHLHPHTFSHLLPLSLLLPPQAAGRHEETVYRDKASGKTLTREQYAEAKAKERRRPEPSKEEQHLEWKGGLAQKKAVDEAKRRMQAEVGGRAGRRDAVESPQQGALQCATVQRSLAGASGAAARALLAARQRSSAAAQQRSAAQQHSSCLPAPHQTVKRCSAHKHAAPLTPLCPPPPPQAAKPFARYADDAERDAELRGRAHWGDPMAGKAGGKRSRWEAEDLTSKYQAAVLTKSGFIIPQEVCMPCPACLPGLHWFGLAAAGAADGDGGDGVGGDGAMWCQWLRTGAAWMPHCQAACCMCLRMLCARHVTRARVGSGTPALCVAYMWCPCGHAPVCTQSCRGQHMPARVAPVLHPCAQPHSGLVASCLLVHSSVTGDWCTAV